MKDFSGTVSIQTPCGKSWDQTPIVLHSFDSRNEAIAAAYAISKQLGKVTVRMVEIPSVVYEPSITVDYVCRLSGSYILAKDIV